MSGTLPRRTARALLRALLLPLTHALLRQPRLKRLARTALDHCPALQTRLHGLLVRQAPLPPRRVHVPQDVNDLSPITRAHYRALKQVFEARPR